MGDALKQLDCLQLYYDVDDSEGEEEDSNEITKAIQTFRQLRTSLSGDFNPYQVPDKVSDLD
jgi:hypothetical protein